MESAKEKYKVVCSGSVEAITELVELLKNQKKDTERFELYQKYYKIKAQDPTYLPVAEALAKCYLDGDGTTRNRITAFTIMEKKLPLCEKPALRDVYLFLAECAESLYRSRKALSGDMELATHSAYTDIPTGNYSFQANKWEVRNSLSIG